MRNQEIRDRLKKLEDSSARQLSRIASSLGAIEAGIKDLRPARPSVTVGFRDGSYRIVFFDDKPTAEAAYGLAIKSLRTVNDFVFVGDSAFARLEIQSISLVKS